MIHVTSLQVRSYSLDFLDISWSIETTNEEIEEYDFFVLRSIDGFAGPYRSIAGPFYNTFMFRDPDVHMLNKWRQYYYRIKTVHRSTQQELMTEPAFLEAEPDRIALELIRRESMLFQEFAGRRAVLFPQLTFGQRCRYCWDLGPKGNTIGRAVQQNCVSCYDSTFVGGYTTPMLIYIQIDPSAKGVQATDLTEHQFVETTARMVSYPPVKPEDMIVEAENKRWRVESVVPTEKLRATIRQEMKLRQYPKGDIKYKVPVNYDILAPMSPAREFTRPMSLQEEQDESPHQWLGSDDEP